MAWNQSGGEGTACGRDLGAGRGNVIVCELAELCVGSGISQETIEFCKGIGC